jgi:hypothetical protein
MGRKDLQYVHEVEFLLGLAYHGYHIYHGMKRGTGYVITRMKRDTNEKSIQMSEKYVIKLGTLLLPSIGGQPQGNATPGKQHITERIPKRKKVIRKSVSGFLIALTFWSHIVTIWNKSTTWIVLIVISSL